MRALAEILKSVVRLGAPGDFKGTGVLIGRNHVLTCAHVIDRGYSLEVYGSVQDAPGLTHNERYNANILLRERIGSLVIGATLFDERYRDAVLEEVHEHLDLALLRLSAPVAAHVQPPDLLDATPKDGGRATAFGFQKIGRERFEIRRSPLGAVVENDERMNARNFTYLGTVMPGMSGGPLFSEDNHRLVGISVLGAEEAANCLIIGGREILKWIKQTSAGNAFRQAGKLPADQLGGWLLLPDEDGHREVLVRPQPLLYSEIDALLEKKFPHPLPVARAGSFAEVEAGEAGTILKAFAAAEGVEGAVLPDPDHLDRICKGAEMEDALPLLRKRRTNLAVHVSDAVTLGGHGFTVLPGDAAEWCGSRDASPVRCMPSRNRGGIRWHRQTSSPFAEGRTEKAALRPAVPVDIWAGCRHE